MALEIGTYRLRWYKQFLVSRNKWATLEQQEYVALTLNAFDCPEGVFDPDVGLGGHQQRDLLL